MCVCEITIIFNGHMHYYLYLYKNSDLTEAQARDPFIYLEYHTAQEISIFFVLTVKWIYFIYITPLLLHVCTQHILYDLSPFHLMYFITYSAKYIILQFNILVIYRFANNLQHNYTSKNRLSSRVSVEDTHIQSNDALTL